MNTFYQDALLITHRPNLIARTEALRWLTSSFDVSVLMKTGHIYRIQYSPETKFDVTSFKIIIPLQVEESRIICFDILDIVPILRGSLFDLITHELSIQIIDDKLFKKIATNQLIRKSVKKYSINNIKHSEKIKFEELGMIINLPLIKSKEGR